MGKNISGLRRWTLEAQYENYLDKYAKQAAKMKKNYGQDMYAPAYSFEQFKRIIPLERDRLTAAGKSTANATMNLVRRQAYEMSQKQAEAGYKMFREQLQFVPQTGKRITVYDFRAKAFGTDIWWSMIEARRGELYASGASKNTVRETITEEFYGGS